MSHHLLPTTRRRGRRSIAALALGILGVGTVACTPPPPDSSVPTSTSTTTPTPASGIEGDYAVTYGSPGAVTIHRSGTTYTMSVKTPFKLAGASCDLPASRVVAVVTGTAPTFTGTYADFYTNCAYHGPKTFRLVRNSDGTLTGTNVNTGEVHVFTRTAGQNVVSTPVDGDYAVTYATAGSVSVHASGATYTMAVKAPFRLQGANCDLPTTTAIATFSGTAPSFTGTYADFYTNCTYSGPKELKVVQNTDGTLTGTHVATGESHLYRRI